MNSNKFEAHLKQKPNKKKQINEKNMYKYINIST